MPSQLSRRRHRRSTERRYAVPTGRWTGAACHSPIAECCSAYAACAWQRDLFRASWLFLLAFLAENAFPRIFHALALIRLRRTPGANFRRHLTHFLLVDTTHGDHRWFLTNDADTI